MRHVEGKRMRHVDGKRTRHVDGKGMLDSSTIDYCLVCHINYMADFCYFCLRLVSVNDYDSKYMYSAFLLCIVLKYLIIMQASDFVQGDTSRCFKHPVDFDVKVVFWY